MSSIPDPATTDWVPLYNLGPMSSYVPSAKVYRNTDQSLASGQSTITFSTMVWDTDGMWSAGSPDRLTVRTAGKYAIEGAVWFAPSSAGVYRIANIELNGSSNMLADATGPRDASANTRVQVVAQANLSVGDYIRLCPYQDAGTLAATSQPPRAPYLAMTYLGPGIAQGAWLPPSYGTSFPASPADGQEHVLVDNVTNPTYQWRFRYNAGHAPDAFKWEFVGGNPFELEVGSGPSGITNVWATFVAGPTFTVPRAGVYLIGIAANGSNNTAGHGPMIAALVDGARVDNSVCYHANPGPGVFVALAKPSVANNANAGSVIALGYTAYSAGVTTFDRSVLTVQPRRVS